MLQDIVQKGATDRSVKVRIIDETTGVPETGVVFNTSGIDLWYRREGAARTAITEATLSALTDAHTDGGFLHVSDGEYRLDLPDAAFATGANYVDFGGTVTGMIVIGGRVRLTNLSLEDAVRAGLTALPNANAEAAGGLYTRGTGAGQINQQANGHVDANLERWINVAPLALSSQRVQVLVGAITNGVIAAATFAANALDAVWSTTTRVLTAGTNIVLVKGTGVTGFTDIDAAGVRTAVGLATANLDTQLGDLPTNAELATALAAADDAVLAAIAALNNLSAAQVNAEVDTGLADYDGPTHAELTSALAAADDAVLAAIAALNNLSAAGAAQAVLDTDMSSFTTAGSLAQRVQREFGTAQAGGASTITLRSGASAVDNIYRYHLVQITGGTGAGQAGVVASYVGSTKVATMAAAWPTTPDNTSVYQVLPGAAATVSGTVDANVVSEDLTTRFPVGTVVDDVSNSATTFETNLTETTDDYWKDALLVITSGALIEQVKKVTAYNGTTKFITVQGGFTAEPASGVTFALVNR